MNNTPFLILLLLFCSPFLATAQKETNNWIFGINAGLNFNNNIPAPIPNSAMNTGEGCSSISDKHGNLILYTDGLQVWNASHHLIINGSNLKGGHSSTQSALIVPQPDSDSIFYIFTVEEAINSNMSLHYSVVNSKASGGIGEVVQKNVFLTNPVCEKLTAVEHYNGRDIWVIVRLWDSNEYHTYLVTENGVDPIPVVNSTGRWINSLNMTIFAAVGSMKISPDGKYLATAYFGDTGYVALHQFNDVTGDINNPIFLDSLPNSYGVEFSLSSRYLYVSNTSNSLHQFDITANDIKASDTIIDSRKRLAALQMARNGKIYACIVNGDSIAVINYPEGRGDSAQLIVNAVYLEGNTTIYGLPAFVQSVFAFPNFTYKIGCFYDSVQFTAITTRYDSILWDFGDPSSGAANYSTKPYPAHKYTQAGIYNVKFISFRKGSSDTALQTIEIASIPQAYLGKDTTLCPSDTLWLKPEYKKGWRYLWSDQSTDSVLAVFNPGSYWVRIYSDSCSVSDTIDVGEIAIPQIDLGKDTLLCPGESLLIDAHLPTAQSYLWQNGSDKPYLEVTGEGEYWVIVTEECENLSDTIYVTYAPEDSTTLSTYSLDCAESLNVDISNQNGDSYLWQDGFGSPLREINEAGVYWVTIAKAHCLYYANIIVNSHCTVLELPNVFTPNGDGINDLLKPLKKMGINRLDFSVYNRWGKLVHRDNTVNWDGLTNTGEQAVEGVYYWMINFTGEQNQSKSLKGNFTLLR